MVIDKGKGADCDNTWLLCPATDQSMIQTYPLTSLTHTEAPQPENGAIRPIPDSCGENHVG